MTHPRLLDEIKVHVPESWEFAAAPFKRTMHYEIFSVNIHSDEFLHVTADLNNKHKGIFQFAWAQRIQNVCMYGRYLLRRQQLMSRNPAETKEEIRYICIPEDKIEALAKHNVDPRYLRDDVNNCTYGNQLTKNALSAIFQFRTSTSPWVLVCARVTTEKDTIVSDSEIYPEYALKLKDFDYQRDFPRYFKETDEEKN